MFPSDRRGSTHDRQPVTAKIKKVRPENEQRIEGRVYIDPSEISDANTAPSKQAAVRD